jgi:hypothetical protein
MVRLLLMLVVGRKPATAYQEQNPCHEHKLLIYMNYIGMHRACLCGSPVSHAKAVSLADMPPNLRRGEFKR